MSFAFSEGEQLASLVFAEVSHSRAPFLFQVVAQLWKAGFQISNWIVRRMRKIGDVSRETGAARTLIEEQLHERHGIRSVERAPGGIEKIESLAEELFQRFSFIGYRKR